jgi:hypothetical protein
MLKKTIDDISIGMYDYYLAMQHDLIPQNYQGLELLFFSLGGLSTASLGILLSSHKTFDHTNSCH